MSNRAPLHWFIPKCTVNSFLINYSVNWIDWNFCWNYLAPSSEINHPPTLLIWFTPKRGLLLLFIWLEQSLFKLSLYNKCIVLWNSKAWNEWILKALSFQNRAPNKYLCSYMSVFCLCNTDFSMKFFLKKVERLTVIISVQYICH